MMTWFRFEHLLWALLVALALGVGLLAHVSLATLSEGLAIQFRRRRPAQILADFYNSKFQTSNSKLQTANFGVGSLKFEVGNLLPIALGGIAALLAWDWLVSSFFLALGIGVSYVFEARGRLAQARQLTRHAEMLVVKFRSMFDVSGSIFATLEAVAKDMPPGAVRRAVEECVALNNTGRLATGDSLRPLKRPGNAHLRRLAGILAHAETASGETFGAVLLDLETDITRQLQVEREAGIELAALKGTARALQGAALLATLWAVLIPAWREYFLASLQQKMLFIFLASTVMGGSMYLEREIFSIEEGQVE